jgi:hypothetical protein
VSAQAFSVIEIVLLIVRNFSSLLPFFSFSFVHLAAVADDGEAGRRHGFAAQKGKVRHAHSEEAAHLTTQVVWDKGDSRGEGGDDEGGNETVLSKRQERGGGVGDREFC